MVIEGSRISAVAPRHEIPAGLPLRELPDGCWLAPGFIDVQVNGGGDVLFNDSPTPEGIRAIAAAHRRFGTTGLLPTLITDLDSTMRHARDAIEEAMKSEPGVLGIHYEGPFLSPEKPGVHNPDLIRPPDFYHRDLITGLPEAATLVTLAPEILPDGFMRALTSNGCPRGAWTFHGDLRRNQSSVGGRPYRLHASVQRHASTNCPRAGSGGGGDGNAGLLVRSDRGRISRLACDAAPRLAGLGHAHARHRRHALCGRKEAGLHALWASNPHARWTLHHG